MQEPLPLRQRWSRAATLYRRWGGWLDAREALTCSQQWLVFAVTALLLACRMPGEVLQPQFYAEDGAIWYQQAYNLGWLHALPVTYAGYLNLLPRIGTGIGLLLPLRWAPLALNLCGLLVQCLPVTALLSARTRPWGSLRTRGFFALLYVFSPNAREVHIVITSAQWHLLLVVVLLAFGAPPLTGRGRLVDVLSFAVASLSGPFALLLTPFLMVFWWVRRHPWTLVQFAVMGTGALAQAICLAHHPEARLHGHLGASFPAFVRIVGGNVLMASLLGGRAWGNHLPMALLALVLLAGLVFYGYVLRVAPLALRLFVVFAWLLFAASLRSPVGSNWPELVRYGSCRYYFLPMLTLLWGLLWCARCAPHTIFQSVARYAFVAVFIGAAWDFHYPGYRDLHFAAEVERAKQAAPGTEVVIPIPPTPPWSIMLKKRGAKGQLDSF